MKRVIIILMLIISISGSSLYATLDEDLIYASVVGNVQEIKKLLDSGAHVNANVFGKGSPLSMASGWGKIDAMRVLLAAGADPNMAIYPGNRVPLGGVLNAFKQGMINHNTALQAAALLLEHGAHFDHNAVQQALLTYPELVEFLKQAHDRARSKLH